MNNHPIKTTDQWGTSPQEQAIFYNVKQFFSDTINRAKLDGDEGERIEVDVYVPSINVAIEYDGRYWHARKVAQDNKKNQILNNLGIYVIRVRDVGLPELDPFEGIVLNHGRSPLGNHLTDNLTETIHILSRFLPEEKREPVEKFELTYEGFLEQRPSIEALLFKTEKEKNFTSHSAFQFWDYEKNKELNPRNLEWSSNAFAWFKCPKGNPIIRIIQNCMDTNDLCAENNSSHDYCVYDICPFLPQDGDLSHGTDCGVGCSYVEPLFIDLVKRFVRNGASENQIDRSTILAIRQYPRVAYEILHQMTIATGTVKTNLEKVFLSEENIYSGRVEFVSRVVCLKSIEELDTILLFNKRYPKPFIVFNWDIFDCDNKGRKKLINYFSELKMIVPFIPLDIFIIESGCSISKELQEMIITFANQQNIYLMDGEFERAQQIQEIRKKIQSLRSK